MIACLAQAAADSSWWTVDPDTYRYFFSASAQVFAAIFAIVAIAYNIKLMDIHRTLDDLRKEKIRKILAIFCQWRSDAQEEFVRKTCNLEIIISPKEAIIYSDDTVLEIICRAILSKFGDKSSWGVGKSNQALYSFAPENIDSLKNSLEIGKRLQNQKKKAIRNTQISIVIASAMIILSFILLWIKFYQRWFIVLNLVAFAAAISIIALLFVHLFSNDRQPKIKSV